MKKIFTLFIITTFCLMTFCLLNTSCTVINKKDEKDLGVYSVKSAEELNKLISLNSNYPYYRSETDLIDVDSDIIAPTDSSVTKINEVNEYKTNVQVDGIDETDIVKVDNEYIYYLTLSRFLILKKNNDSLDIILEEKFNNQVNTKVSINEVTYKNPVGLYHTDKYVIMLCELSKPINKDDFKESEYLWYYPRETFTVVSIYDKTDYKLAKEYCFEGTYNTSRLVNDQLYVINNLYYRYTQNDDLRPKLLIDQKDYQIDYSKIKYLSSDNVNNSYTNIFNIVLDDEITLHDMYFLNEKLSTNYIYVSYKSIYFIDYYDDYQQDLYLPQSVITVFDINQENHNITYGGLYIVEGHIQDKYWVDEYNGYLRLATTGRKYQDSKSIVFNYLYILKRAVVDGKYGFEEVSSIKEGLGKPNESVKSVRFNEDVATIVTFETKDPLYYIDIKDPYNPIITSSLEVSGYSVYQHPYKDNYIIGIGYESNEKGLINGIKIALYDISDKTNIHEVGNPIVFLNTNSNSYYTYALYDPKNIMFNLEENMFGFSINNNIYSGSYENDNSYYVFSIDLNCKTPLSIKDKFKYQKQTELTSYLYNQYYYYDSNQISRMVFIKDNYYLLANQYIETLKYDGSSFKHIAILPFK